MREAMKPREIHHIGHAVEDIADAVATYERLFGAVAEHHETVPEQGVEAVSLRVGADRIELLRPLGEQTPVGRFMASRGPGMHHVAYSVDDIRAALRDASAAGAELIDEEPHAGLFGLQVAFIHPSSVAGVLVEYVQVEGAVDG
jgi:methylmalonyl-CoA/ethylmalonyl-CoA epimerase